MMGSSVLVAWVDAIELAQQGRPGNRSSDATGRNAQDFGGVALDVWVDTDQFTAGLCGELDLARRLERVHGEECVGNRGTDGQQAMIAQDHVSAVAKIGPEARLLVRAQCNALV